MYLVIINSCILIFLFSFAIYSLASAAGQGASPCPESLPGEASKITSLNETIGQEQPERAALSHSSTPTINLQTIPGMVKHENCNKVVALHDSELCLAMGWVFYYFSIAI